MIAGIILTVVILMALAIILYVYYTEKRDQETHEKRMQSDMDILTNRVKAEVAEYKRRRGIK